MIPLNLCTYSKASSFFQVLFGRCSLQYKPVACNLDSLKPRKLGLIKPGKNRRPCLWTERFPVEYSQRGIVGPSHSGPTKLGVNASRPDLYSTSFSNPAQVKNV